MEVLGSTRGRQWSDGHSVYLVFALCIAVLPARYRRADARCSEQLPSSGLSAAERSAASDMPYTRVIKY
jgi:hypothetical protein